MRKLKFRFWLGDTMQGILELEQGGILDMPWKWDKADQFTGLLDKQGKEIYEGDIWRITEDNYEIVFYNGQFTMAESESNEARIILVLGTLRQFEKGEVIGNIYENKELTRG